MSRFPAFYCNFTQLCRGRFRRQSSCPSSRLESSERQMESGALKQQAQKLNVMNTSYDS